MPYLAHFGLKEHPFTLTPNTNQYFPIDKHVEIRAPLKIPDILCPSVVESV